MISRLSVVLTLLLLATQLVVAQVDDEGNVNDPTTNPRANACYEGGSMQDKCDTDWEWKCGWHLIRFEEGLTPLDQFPIECSSLLPEALRPENAPECEAISDEFTLNPADPNGTIPAPGILANDTCESVVGFGSIQVLQGGSVVSLIVNADGSIEYAVTEPNTIFTFAYVTDGGAFAMVTINHDTAFAGGL